MWLFLGSRSARVAVAVAGAATSVADPGEQFPRAFASTTGRVIIGAPPWTNRSGDYKPDVNKISSYKRGWIVVTWTLGTAERVFIREQLLDPLDRRGTAIASIRVRA